MAEIDSDLAFIMLLLLLMEADLMLCGDKEG